MASLKSKTGRVIATGLLTATVTALMGVMPVSSSFAAGNIGVTIQQGNSATTQRIILPLNKAAIVTLPVDARDVLVASPKVMDAIVRTSRQVYLLGLSVGSTNAFFFDKNGNQILNLEVTVERDLTALEDMLKQRFPDAKIQVQALNDNIILTGTVKSALESRNAFDIAGRFIGSAEAVLNTLSVLGQEQVMLKVRVAEVNRQVIKQLGIDWNLVISKGTSFATGLQLQNAFGVNGAPASGLGSLGAVSTNVVVPGSDPIVAATTGISLNNRFGNVRVGADAAVQALESHGLVRTLAEPTLTALTGETANFLAGGEFPIPVSREDNEISVEFKPFGVSLAFTPIVLNEGRISMKVATEVSDLSSEGSITIGSLTLPGIAVRRATTTVELPSGGSLVLAGMLSQDTRNGVQSLPGATDVPILGALFKSTDFLNNETELVIIATPYLVEPTHESNLRLPSDGFAPASDYDSYLMSRLHAVYGEEGAQAPVSQPKGPVGYIME